MQMKCLLCRIDDDKNHGFLAISPGSNLWFVERDSFPPDLAPMVDPIEAKGTIVVLGAIMEGDEMEASSAQPQHT